MSKREQVLNALLAWLSALPDVEVKRNAVLPVRKQFVKIVANP